VLKLLVLRHGETEFSRARRFTGALDVGLTALGQQQMEAAASALAGTGIHAAYSSPQERARTSAEVVAKPHRLDVRLDPRFAEMRFGAWEGLTRDEAAGAAPAVFEAWRQAPGAVTPPGGEPLADVAARVAAGLHDVHARHADQTVVLVTHAVVVRLIVLTALGLSIDRLWTVDASPGGLTELEYRPGWTTVHRMNTLSHLDGVAR